jgi:hypothetical protein
MATSVRNGLMRSSKNFCANESKSCVDAKGAIVIVEASYHFAAAAGYRWLARLRQ